MTLHLSRVELDPDAPTRALSALIDPEEKGAAMDAHHRLIWTLFADHPERERDFLWRAGARGRFYVLSARPPRPNDLFRPIDTRPFEPSLAPGDRLAFSLRANATKDRARGGLDPRAPNKDRRVDVVMDALKDVPAEGGRRAEIRFETARSAGRDWLERQGRRRGFRIVEMELEDYSTTPLPRQGRRGARFGVLDMTGVIEVTEPEAFVPALARGFGRAKAFGCGLMLVRRA